MDVEEGGKKEKKEEEKGMEVDEEREGEEAKDVLEFWFGPNVSECAHQKWFTSQKQQVLSPFFSLSLCLSVSLSLSFSFSFSLSLLVWSKCS